MHIFSNIKKVYSVTSTVKEYSDMLEQCTPNDMAAYLSNNQGGTPFCSIFDHTATIAVAKMKILLA